jgi:hypothetical protein
MQMAANSREMAAMLGSRSRRRHLCARGGERGRERLPGRQPSIRNHGRRSLTARHWKPSPPGKPRMRDSPDPHALGLRITRTQGPSPAEADRQQREQTADFGGSFAITHTKKALYRLTKDCLGGLVQVASFLGNSTDLQRGRLGWIAFRSLRLVNSGSFGGNRATPANADAAGP